MRTTFRCYLDEVLILLMLFTGKFPKWADIAILVIILISIAEVTVRLVKKYKAAKQAKP